MKAGGFGDHALFVVGADQAADFGRWREPEEILKWVKLAVGTRAGYPLPDLSVYGDRVVAFELSSPDVSSSEVRRRVAAGEPIDDLVPAEVARLIEELGLYRRSMRRGSSSALGAGLRARRRDRGRMLPPSPSTVDS